MSIDQIKEILKDLNGKYPDWDKEVTSILSNDEHNDNIGVQSGTLDMFTDTLKRIVKLANEDSIPLEEVLSVFEECKCFEYAKIYISRSMHNYDGFRPLRELEKTGFLNTKSIIDLIWTSYIIRYDPYLDFTTINAINEDDYLSVASRLDAFSDMCVARQLCKSSIKKNLIDETGLSDDVCEYITEKIDTDFDKLRLNFIIERITSK